MKLLKFSASWCQPCKMLTNTINNIPNKPELLEKMQEIDIDENVDLVTKYGIRGVPTLVVVDDKGNTIKSMSGSITKDKLLDFIS